jgi:hypothetical protein
MIQYALTTKIWPSNISLSWGMEKCYFEAPHRRISVRKDASKRPLANDFKDEYNPNLNV